ncbi:MAG: tRNA (adenosine(37)-N6)-dimethylallyltransferase MiaA [Pseudomonadota bacterium]
MIDLEDIPAKPPILIAGPTASGKSTLALTIATRMGGRIINADALQVFSNWRLLTARPDADELSRAPHSLYGHVPGDADYSVGHWLREVEAELAKDGPRPIIVGGTNLYFQALTEGLVDIPPIPQAIRTQGDAIRRTAGHAALLEALDAADPQTASRIDRQNPRRVQRAWEVLRSTGRGLTAWQADTPPPLLPLAHTIPLVAEADRAWLNTRINQRFDMMMECGALEEARVNLATWDPAHPSSKAIGAPELIAFLKGDLSLESATALAKRSSRRYAKRQQTWIRARMGGWRRVRMPRALRIE